MHWRVLINQHGEEVGHPSGNLQSVGYLHYYGLDHDAPKANLTRMAAICDNLDPYDEYLSQFEPSSWCTWHVFPPQNCTTTGQTLTLISSTSNILVATSPPHHLEKFVKAVKCNL